MRKEIVYNMNTYLKTLSPYIRVALDSKITPPWEINRVIFDYELLLIKEGQALITIEDKIYEGVPGDIFLFKPKENHSIKIIGNDVFYQPHIHFDLYYEANSPDVKISYQLFEEMDKSSHHLFRENISEKSYPVIPNHITLKNTGYFEKMLFEIIKEYEAKLPYCEIQMKGLFIQLWTYLIREIFWDTNPDITSYMKPLLEIKDYITLNANRKITLDEIESKFSMSKYHIIRLFKNTYGMTPIHLHQLIRIEKAKEMIQFTDYSLTEIAELLGFNSIHSFSRAFKKTDSVSPSFYRKH